MLSTLIGWDRRENVWSEECSLKAVRLSAGQPSVIVIIWCWSALSQACSLHILSHTSLFATVMPRHSWQAQCLQTYWQHLTGTLPSNVDTTTWGFCETKQLAKRNPLIFISTNSITGSTDWQTDKAFKLLKALSLSTDEYNWMMNTEC